MLDTILPGAGYIAGIYLVLDGFSTGLVHARACLYCVVKWACVRIAEVYVMLIVDV